MNDRGYEIIFDNTTNRPIAIERATGEVYETTTRTVPVGSIFYTPEQQRDYRERNKAKEEKQMYRKHADALGNYFFISADSSINTIKPETLTRLIYLCTYGEYNTERLRKTQRTIMKKSDLPVVLNVSESTALRFFNDAQNYITENKNGELILCRTLFKKGTLSKQEYIPYQKIYSKAFRELYQRSSPNMHKRMGYIFQLIPYINIEHNVLCYNPDEQNFCDIEFMSTQDFCNEIGYSFLYHSIHNYSLSLL